MAGVPKKINATHACASVMGEGIGVAAACFSLGSRSTNENGLGHRTAQRAESATAWALGPKKWHRSMDHSVQMETF